jgi:FHA domain
VFTLLYNDSGKPHRHVLAHGTTTVGRAPGNDLLLHHGSVSRWDAVIEVDDGSCRITDVGRAWAAAPQSSWDAVRW